MAFQPWQLGVLAAHARRVRLYKAVITLVVSIGIIGTAIWWASSRSSKKKTAITLEAIPATQRVEKQPTGDVVDFAPFVCDEIRKRGRITVTVYVALADRKRDGISTRFGDSDKPESNLYWGARYGVETFLTQVGGWRRVYADDGDGERILRRIVLHRQADTAPGWESRGITQPFDVYVLANAWRGSAAVGAMQQPIRDALGGETVRLTVDGTDMEFGGGGVMSGYVGQNAMADGYEDPFVGLAEGPSGRRMGVFCISNMSAIYLHQPVVDHGLYSVFFVRRDVVPEAYVLEGLLEALLRGELDDGFIAAAAEWYVQYQKGCTLEKAKFLFYR